MCESGGDYISRLGPTMHEYDWYSVKFIYYCFYIAYIVVYCLLIHCMNGMLPRQIPVHIVMSLGNKSRVLVCSVMCVSLCVSVRVCLSTICVGLLAGVMRFCRSSSDRLV